jgi:hypothetical protein
MYSGVHFPSLSDIPTAPAKASIACMTSCPLRTDIGLIEQVSGCPPEHVAGWPRRRFARRAVIAHSCAQQTADWRASADAITGGAAQMISGGETHITRNY